MDMLELKKNDTHILGLKGKLDAVTSPALRNRLLELVRQGERRILLDCANLEYVSSAGLRVLFEIAAQLQAVSGRLACCSVNSNVRKVFDLVELPADIPVFANEEESLK